MWSYNWISLWGPCFAAYSAFKGSVAMRGVFLNSAALLVYYPPVIGFATPHFGQFIEPMLGPIFSREATVVPKRPKTYKKRRAA